MLRHPIKSSANAKALSAAIAATKKTD